MVLWRYKIRILLKEYANTKDEIIKNQIIEISKERLIKIANNYRAKNTNLDKAYLIAYKAFEESIDKYIELNDDSISLYTFSDKIIKEILKQESANYKYKNNIQRLLASYENTNDKNKQKEIMKEIIEISEDRLIGIVKKYELLNLPYVELMQVAKYSLIYSVNTFQSAQTSIFSVYSLQIINKNIEKYTYFKSNFPDLNIKIKNLLTIENEELVIYLLDLYKKIIDEIIKIENNRLEDLAFSMHQKTGLPYKKIYKITLENFIESTKQYDKTDKIDFEIYSYEYISNKIDDYVGTKLEKQLKTQRKKETSNNKTQILLEEYKQTKDEKIKFELLNMNIKRIEKIISKKNYKNISREEMFEIAKETFCDAVDEYISLNNDKISFQVYITQMIEERLKTTSKKYINTKKIKKLLDSYETTRSEEIKDEIVELSLNRLNNIIENINSENVTKQELLEVAIESLKYSIETFHTFDYSTFDQYSKNLIKRNIKQYIYCKTINENEKRIRMRGLTEKLLEKYKETKDISIRNKMIEINLDIVKDLAKKYENENIDDLENILAIKLIECVDSYISGNINIYFRLYLRKSLTLLIKKIIRKKEKGDNISLNTPNKQEEKLIGTSIIRNSVDTLNIDFSDIAKEILQTLNEKERRIIKMYYGISPYRKHTLVEIAKEYNVSRQRITQIIETRLEKIKNILISNNYNPFQIKNETLRVVEAQELLNDEMKLIYKL